MVRGLAIALAAVALAAPAHAEGESSENPFAVTWDVRAPRVAPLPFSLDDSGFVPPRLALRMEPGALGFRPSAAADLWGRDVRLWEPRFQKCDGLAVACTDEPPIHFGLRLSDDGDGGLRVGALVRLGEQLESPRRSSKNAWRLYLAADAHALTWDFDRRDGEGFRLEDLLTLGDVQVGVAHPLWGGDVTLGLIHREISGTAETLTRFESASRTEQFGGITFTTRR